MRPSRSFLLLLFFLVLFTGLHYISPLPGLFPSVEEFIPPGLTKFVKGNSIEPARDINVTPDTSFPGDSTVKSPARSPDSLRTDTSLVSYDPLKTLMDSLLDPDRQTRIMYYGDSQIEGDRITSWLRQSLREISGGTGPGLLLPVMPVMYTKTVWIRSSSNWKRYNFLSFQNKEITHRKLGPFMVICRYLPEGESAVSPEKAWVKIRPSRLADSTSLVYDQLRIFYRNSEGTVNISVLGDEKLICMDTLSRNSDIGEFSCRLNDPEEITVEFSGMVSPDIYGISIESSKGVIVDNIPQRGSAGLEFTMVDKSNLDASFSFLDPDLIVLQYGLNIVRNVRTDYSYYSKGLNRQLSLIREISEGAPVLVIGVTDMAGGRGDSLKSYPNIPAISEAQKKASEQAGAIFWDPRKAMGEGSSVIKWAQKEPPLIQKDFVHLTYEGADTLGRILADSVFFVHLEQVKETADPGKNAEKQTAITSPVDPGSPGTGEAANLLNSIFRYDPEKPMIFTTAAFWIFMLIALSVYSLIYRKLFLRNFYLFLISLFFYYKSGGLFLILLLLVTVVDFSAGLIIGNSQRKFIRKLFILLSIISNLGILAYFKYTGFLVNTVNDLAGTDFRVYDFMAEFPFFQMIWFI